MEHPTKVLSLQDLIFILPDDFDGDLTDAFHELYTYMRNNRQEYTHVEDYANLVSPLEILLHSKEKRLYMEVGMFNINKVKPESDKDE